MCAEGSDALLIIHEYQTNVHAILGADTYTSPFSLNPSKALFVPFCRQHCQKDELWYVCCIHRFVYQADWSVFPRWQNCIRIKISSIVITAIIIIIIRCCYCCYC